MKFRQKKDPYMYSIRHLKCKFSQKKIKYLQQRAAVLICNDTTDIEMSINLWNMYVLCEGEALKRQ